MGRGPGQILGSRVDITSQNPYMMDITSEGAVPISGTVAISGNIVIMLNFIYFKKQKLPI